MVQIFLLLLGFIALLFSNLFIIYFFRRKLNAVKKLSTLQIAEKGVTVEQQEKLKEATILSNIGEGLVIIDKHGQIVTFNKAAQKLLEWTEEEALGKNFSDIVKIDYGNSIEIKTQAIGSQSSLH